MCVPDVTGVLAALKEEVWEGGLQICPDFDGCPISWCVRKALLWDDVPTGAVPSCGCALRVGSGTGGAPVRSRQPRALTGVRMLTQRKGARLGV